MKKQWISINILLISLFLFIFGQWIYADDNTVSIDPSQATYSTTLSSDNSLILLVDQPMNVSFGNDISINIDGNGLDFEFLMNQESLLTIDVNTVITFKLSDDAVSIYNYETMLASINVSLNHDTLDVSVTDFAKSLTVFKELPYVDVSSFENVLKNYEEHKMYYDSLIQQQIETNVVTPYHALNITNAKAPLDKYDSIHTLETLFNSYVEKAIPSLSFDQQIYQQGKSNTIKIHVYANHAQDNPLSLSLHYEESFISSVALVQGNKRTVISNDDLLLDSVTLDPAYNDIELEVIFKKSGATHLDFEFFDQHKAAHVSSYFIQIEPLDVDNSELSEEDIASGAPFTTDSCGNVFDRWGNEVYHAPSCIGISTNLYSLVDTSDRA